MIIYQQAEAQHIPGMTALWAETFGDSEGYIRGFYAHWFAKAVCLIAAENGTVVGMIHMLPFRLRQNGKERSCYYIYAGAVSPAYRGQGIFTGLVRIVHQRSEAEQADILGMPASEGLFSYYARFGYRKVPFYADAVCEHAAGQTVPAAVTELAAADYARMRNAMLQAMPGAAVWENDDLRYALDEIRCSGGFARLIETAEGACAVLGYADSETVRITELAAEHGARADYLAAVSALFPGRAIRCRCFPGEPGGVHCGIFRTADGSEPTPCYFPLDFV